MQFLVLSIYFSKNSTLLIIYRSKMLGSIRANYVRFDQRKEKLMSIDVVNFMIYISENIIMI